MRAEWCDLIREIGGRCREVQLLGSFVDIFDDHLSRLIEGGAYRKVWTLPNLIAFGCGDRDGRHEDAQDARTCPSQDGGIFDRLGHLRPAILKHGDGRKPDCSKSIGKRSN